jgi:hypothetical protein
MVHAASTLSGKAFVEKQAGSRSGKPLRPTELSFSQSVRACGDDRQLKRRHVGGRKSCG